MIDTENPALINACVCKIRYCFLTPLIIFFTYVLVYVEVNVEQPVDQTSLSNPRISSQRRCRWRL